MSKTTEKHKSEAPKSVRCAVLTVSDSKFDYIWSRNKSLEETEDVSGMYIVNAFREAHHEVVFYTIVPDHADVIAAMIDHVAKTYSPDAIVTTGGTGVASRDVTIEAVRELFDKELEGFGELFRKESFEKLGSAALLSRAAAGVYDGVLIFSLPGSPHAVETGMKIILQEVAHLVKHVRE